MLYPPPRVIAIDVDGTLCMEPDGSLNQDLVDWCFARKADGYQLILWSSGGEAHALASAQRFQLVDLFDHIISKPGFIVDDHGWGWIRFTHVVSFLEYEKRRASP